MVATLCGYSIMIDDEDAELLTKYTWHIWDKVAIELYGDKAILNFPTKEFMD